jgi:hypothetical protein
MWTTTVRAEPSITDVTPSHGPTAGGFAITISGASFSAAGNSVLVSSRSCSVTGETPEQIVCTAPEGSGASAPVRVLDSLGLASQPFPFGYDAPALTNVTPSSGSTAGNVLLTINGLNFGPDGAARSVTIGTAACPPAVGAPASHTSIVCTLPEGQGHDLALDVTVDGQVSSAALSFSYDPPSITSVTPSSGASIGGTRLTINGNNFGTQAFAGVGGTLCPVQLQTHTRVECTLPAGFGSNVPVQVTVGGQLSNVGSFSYAIVASKCDAAKWKAAGQHAACLANAESKAAKKGVAPDAVAVTKCDDKFTASCTKAETKLEDCSQLGTCDDLSLDDKGWDGTIKGNIQ